MSRPIKPRCISFYADAEIFSPIPKCKSSGRVIIYADEIEALRLVDYEGMSQEEAGEKMGISRGTVWRLLQSGRAKIISMVVERRQLIVKKDRCAP